MKQQYCEIQKEWEGVKQYTEHLSSLMRKLVSIT